jgi:hypothetical protein
VQGVFINPAFIEPFGLTLIEVLFFIRGIVFLDDNLLFETNINCYFFPLSRQQLMDCPLLPQKMEVQ